MADAGVPVPAPAPANDLAAETERCWRLVTESPHDFAAWEYLIQLQESQPDLSKIRAVLVEFLKVFPLCFGYWKKLADLEMVQFGEGKVAEVYESAIAAAPYCYDLWYYYGCFMADRVNKETYEETKRVFERGAEKIGRYFLSHPFWDRYLQLLESFNDRPHQYVVLDRIIRKPLQQYPRFYERFLKLAGQRPLPEMATAEELAEYEENIKNADSSLTDEQVKAKTRELIVKKKHEIHKKNEENIRKRWHFEEAIVVPYFHVKALDENQLKNWRSYLDFEEKEGDVNSTIDLYERCLIPCALYEEFWIRYTRFLAGKGMNAEADAVFVRALSGFLSKKPSLLVAHAQFKEEIGAVEDARTILEGAKSKFVGHVETITALANLERRAGNVQRAEEIYEEGLRVTDEKISPYLITLYAKFLHSVAGNTEKARKTYVDGLGKYKESKLLFSNYLAFEHSLPVPNFDELSSFLTTLRASGLQADDKAELILRHISFLENRASDLRGINELVSEYTQLRGASGFSRKRPYEDDLQGANKQARIAEPLPNPASQGAWGWGQPQQQAWGGFGTEQAWQQPQQPWQY